jgi:pyruvate,orthophosphate dikinase
MSALGLPVPPGFTITTECCTHFYANGRTYPKDLKAQVAAGLARIEQLAGKRFGDPENPLLVSVRSGARASMPGMMDTVLNLGLNDKTVAGLAKLSGDKRFAFDSYRRFIQMYSNVVLGLDHHTFEEILDDHKDRLGVEIDTSLSAEDWERVVADYKAAVERELGHAFPQDPEAQLWGAVGAVFDSWMNDRAKFYRRMHDIPESWGTAVNVQSMVFGNMGDTSATGVAFTRNPSTGEHRLYGEFLINAQGEDVVAGLRTPQSLTKIGREEMGESAPSMEEALPEVFVQFKEVVERLEKHYRDMQDIEFTVERGRLYMLQTRNGKRTAKAALKVAVDLCNEGLISREEAVMRVEPASLDQLLHPTIDPKATRAAATGKVVFDADEAERLGAGGEAVILVREETSPEDIHGMHAAKGVITARGGMTSHAAVVARGMGRPCVSGAGEIQIFEAEGLFRVRGRAFKVGDVVTIDGSKGEVLAGAVKMVEPELSGDFATLMTWADAVRRLKVRANAETPLDAKTARGFGAEGIGLCRTEHMFFDAERIAAVREMILADDEAGRRAALAKLLPMQRNDFAELFRIMDGLPVTIRLLDPPLHEFLPHTEEDVQAVGGKAPAPGARAEGGQPDARLARLPARRDLPRDLRDAGPGDLRGRLRGEEGRSDAVPGSHASARGHGSGNEAAARADRPHRQGGHAGDGRGGRLPGRHHDRAAARGAEGRPIGAGGRVLLLRHQRSDPDHLRHQPRRLRPVPERLYREGRVREGPVRQPRPGRRGRPDPDRRRARAPDPAGHEARDLRRTRRGPGLDRLLRGGGSGLRLVLALSHPDRAAGGGAGGLEPEGLTKKPLVIPAGAPARMRGRRAGAFKKPPLDFDGPG